MWGFDHKTTAAVPHTCEDVMYVIKYNNIYKITEFDYILLLNNSVLPFRKVSLSKKVGGAMACETRFQKKMANKNGDKMNACRRRRFMLPEKFYVSLRDVLFIT